MLKLDTESSSDAEHSLGEELTSLRISLEDILEATNNFAEENLLKRSGKADVYKGLLLRSEVENDVVIRKYRSSTDLTFEFYKDIKNISCVKHKNVVSLIGFCDEEDERMIVMEHAVNGSLDAHLNDTTLTWSQRLHICFGVAVGLSHLRRCFTKGFKILLDKNWEAKVLPCIESSWCNTENSAVYSFGLILLEVLSGRKTTIEDVNQYLAKMEKGKQLDDIILNEGRKMNPESLSLFSETAYKCLKEQPDQQSQYMFEQIVKGLKEAFEMQWKHEYRIPGENYESLKIPLNRIKSATDNFSITYSITSNMYERVYKAELGLSNEGSVLTQKSVIIKRIFSGEKLLKDFFEEIKMLKNCNHRSLPTFLGFCDEESEMILIFECVFEETLNGYLRDTSNRANLTWEKRIRICLDIAHGLKYLQKLKGKPSMILSANVFLAEKCTAMIADFSLSEFNSRPKYLGQSGQRLVIDDDDDIYFLGVILFEILTGRLAYDPFYIKGNVNGFASMARQQFNEGKLKSMADHRIMEEVQEFSYPLKKGPNQESFDTFTKTAYQCLLQNPSERPTLGIVIKSLNEALRFQVKSLEHPLRIPLKDVISATKNFKPNGCIGSGTYGEVYKATLKLKSKEKRTKIPYTVAIKRILRREDDQGKDGFLAEIDVLSKCEHPNIVSLFGFCYEGSEMLLVYEYVSNGSLDNYLESNDKMSNVTWAQRLNMCIHIAKGLEYLHTTTEDKQRIIHRDIKSANILLGENLEAKIADLGLSKGHHGNQVASTIKTNHIAGTNLYLDPEYARTGQLKKASDIYSFGVVLFEIFSGKLASDSYWENRNGLAPIAQRHFQNGSINEILDPRIMNESHELSSSIKVGPDPKSLSAFSKIACQCLAKSQAERPKIEEVIKELEEALKFQKNRKDTFKMSLEDIRLGVENVSDNKCIIGGHIKLYRGEVQYNNGLKKVVIKRFNRSGEEHGFLKEFEVLFKYKQDNIIGLVGYCKEMDEKIIVYEDASNGCLSTCLNDSSFSWRTRLKICIDIANGLKFLHGGDVGQDVVIHRDLKSSKVLLTDDWKAKICGFEVAFTYPTSKETEYINNDIVGSPGDCDPLYPAETHILTKENDIYSFGVILFEILCGRLACPDEERDHDLPLHVFVKSHAEAGRLGEIVFEGIKKHIVLKSFATFLTIAFQCLHEKREERPTAIDVVVQLQKALEFQEAYEKRKAKLERTYEETLHEFSWSPESYSTIHKKDIYNILSKGILLEDDKELNEQTILDMEHSLQFIGGA